jgi:four helix bundle protein
MEKSKKFYDTIVWQKSHRFVLEVYKYTSIFPKVEDYALTSQFRRAAVSITANIAEGFARKSLKEKIRFYNISQGSLEECRNYLILSRDLNYSNPDNLLQILEEVSVLLNSYIFGIEKNILSGVEDSSEEYEINN